MDASDDHEGQGVTGSEATKPAGKRSLFSGLRKSRPEPADETARPEPDLEAQVAAAAGPGPAMDAATVQVMAHTLIADLFGTGLRIQQIAARAPEELQDELEEVAEHVDKAIRELRAFAFEQRE